MIPKTRAPFTDAVVLRCDVCKGETFVGGASTDAEVRKVAALSGWRHVDGKDYCPKEVVPRG